MKSCTAILVLAMYPWAKTIKGLTKVLPIIPRGTCWENHNYEKIPYRRGALFAAYLSKRITEQSKGTKSYQDFLRSLKALAEQKKQLLTIEDFIKVASAYIPKAEIEASIQQYIIKGEMMEEERVW